MRRQERDREARLEAALDRLDALEQRVLSDLRRAGYRFMTVGQARSYRKALATKRARVAADGYEFTPEQLAIAMAAVEKAERSNR